MSLRIPGGSVLFNRKIGNDYQGLHKFGSTQGFTLSTEKTKLPSYNNDDTGIGVKEAEVVTRSEQSGVVTIRKVTFEELAIAFGAENVTAKAQSAGSLTETISGVKQGRYYRLGVAPGFPTGARMLSGESIEVSSVAKTGYELDASRGLIYIVPGGDIANGDDVDVSAALAQANWDAVIASDAEAAGELQVIGTDAAADPLDHYMPNTTLALEGEYSLKADPENPAWFQLQLAVSVLADTERGLAPVYIDGKAA